jgi:hypothetical protein
LGFGIVFGCVAHIDPVDQGLLDPLSGEVGTEFLDALYGLLKVEPLCAKPDHFALPGVELDILQQRPNDIAYFHVLPAFGGVHPLEELVDERVVREDAVLLMFLPLPAHAVLKRIWANAARFVLARSRTFRSIHGASGHRISLVADSFKRSSPSGRDAVTPSRLLGRFVVSGIMSIIMVNEL